MTGWTDERIERLTALWAEGKSASEIAAIFGGVTRAAVIGKVWRLKLPKRSKDEARLNMMRICYPGRKLGAGALQKAREAKPKPEKVRRVVHAPSVISTIRLKPMPPPPPGVPLDPAAARPWIERAFGECAYPVGGEGADTLSCCLKTNGKTYCAAHLRLMYAPNKANENLKKASSLRGLRRAA